MSRTINTTCDERLSSPWSVSSPGRDIRSVVVSRCSGVSASTCRLDLSLDLPESRSWGTGRLVVRYTCQEEVFSYCGGKISAEKPGYISSPAYPK